MYLTLSNRQLWKHILSNNVKNIVAKGEIAQFKQFLLLSQCFRRASAAEALESMYLRERVNAYPQEEVFAADNFETS